MFALSSDRPTQRVKTLHPYNSSGRGRTLVRMGLPQQIKQYTPQDYYELESSAEYKSEYYKGEIFAMAGGSARHSLICLNIGGELRSRLRDTPCTPFESNMRLKIEATGLRTYPDASVYCDPLRYDEEDPAHQTFVNPTVLFEVLSPSTEAYDRGEKSMNYRQIESLRAYVLISQDSPHVEIFERQSNNSWVLNEVNGLASTLTIPPLKISLPVSEIYLRVNFNDPAQAAEPAHA